MGVFVYEQHLLGVGLADDVVVLSEDIHFLRKIFFTSVRYRQRYHMALAPEKTKFLVFNAAS